MSSAPNNYQQAKRISGRGFLTLQEYQQLREDGNNPFVFVNRQSNVGGDSSEDSGPFHSSNLIRHESSGRRYFDGSHIMNVVNDGENEKEQGEEEVEKVEAVEEVEIVEDIMASDWGVNKEEEIVAPIQTKIIAEPRDGHEEEDELCIEKDGSRRVLSKSSKGAKASKSAKSSKSAKAAYYPSGGGGGAHGGNGGSGGTGGQEELPLCPETPPVPPTTPVTPSTPETPPPVAEGLTTSSPIAPPTAPSVPPPAPTNSPVKTPTSSPISSPIAATTTAAPSTMPSQPSVSSTTSAPSPPPMSSSMTAAPSPPPVSSTMTSSPSLAPSSTASSPAPSLAPSSSTVSSAPSLPPSSSTMTTSVPTFPQTGIPPPTGTSQGPTMAMPSALDSTDAPSVAPSGAPSVAPSQGIDGITTSSPVSTSLSSVPTLQRVSRMPVSTGGNTSMGPSLPPGSSMAPAGTTTSPSSGSMSSVPTLSRGTTAAPSSGSMSFLPTLSRGPTTAPASGSSLPPGTTASPVGTVLSSVPTLSRGTTLPPGMSSSPVTASMSSIPTMSTTLGRGTESLPPASANLDCVPFVSEDFESGEFPIPPWTTGGDGEWAVDSSRPFEGNYALRSPTLTGNTLQVSNATLTLCDDFPGGRLTTQVVSSVLPPSDFFEIYVDGMSVNQLVDIQEYTDVTVDIAPGPHVVDFSYRYNLFSLDTLPPSPLEREGVVFIDNVAMELISTRMSVDVNDIISLKSQINEKTQAMPETQNGANAMVGNSLAGAALFTSLFVHLFF